jgi:5'-methylthioadenosine phosphorylase
MGRLAVVLGSSAAGPGGREMVEAVERSGALALQRHGSPYTLPHRIDHVANMRSIADAGCDRVLAIGSVGSLRVELTVGTTVCPDDFIALQVGATALTDERGHATPGFDSGWRDALIAAWGAGAAAPRDGGVYWQTIGPRFETPAEIRLIAAHADLVGMTIGSECVIAGELGLRYAAICCVDNLANGIEAEPLSPGEVERQREQNARALHDALAAAVPELV